MPVTQYGVGAGLVDMGLITDGWGFTYTAAITATAGGGRANAVPLVNMVNQVTTVATAADSVALPPAYGGQTIVVVNAAATNAAQVFAAVGTSDTINGVAAATGVSLAAGKAATYVSVPGAWYGNLSA